jgi:MoaA/NifB/PqqE/SkfB family radical SAM enzyme
MNATMARHLARRVALDPAEAWRHLHRRMTLALDLRRTDGWSAPPRIISLKLTDRCNLKCAMCDQFGPEGRLLDKRKRSPAMAIDAIHRLLAEASDFKPAIYLTGGEPMLHPQILEIVKMITERHGLQCEMNTNGLLVGMHAFELVNTCKIDILTISVHGPDARANDAVVGINGAFEKVCASIRAVRILREDAGSRRPLIRINCVVTKEIHDRIEDMVRFAGDVGADQINVQHPIYTTDEVLARHAERFADVFGTDSPGLSGYLNSASGIDPHTLKAQLDAVERGSDCLRVTFYPSVCAEEIDAYYTEPFHLFKGTGCTAPWLRATILPNGDVTPCLDLIVGNAFSGGIGPVWNSETFRAFRSALAKTGLFPGCLRCCHRRYQ